MCLSRQVSCRSLYLKLPQDAPWRTGPEALTQGVVVVLLVVAAVALGATAAVAALLQASCRLTSATTHLIKSSSSA